VQMSAEPAVGPAEETVNGADPVPEDAVEPVAPIGDGIFPFAPGEGCHQCNHLVMGNTMFQNILVIADAGVGFPCFHDPVEDKLSIFALV